MSKELVYDRYATQIAGVQYSLEFKNRLTLVKGDSGAGKTLLYKALKNDAALGLLEAIFFDYSNVDSGVIESSIRSSQHKFFVIDNGAVILDFKLRDIIRNSTSNQFLIFTHNTDGYSPGASSIAVLVIDGMHGTLEYPLYWG